MFVDNHLLAKTTSWLVDDGKWGRLFRGSVTASLVHSTSSVCATPCLLRRESHRPLLLAARRVSSAAASRPVFIRCCHGRLCALRCCRVRPNAARHLDLVTTRSSPPRGAPLPYVSAPPMSSAAAWRSSCGLEFDPPALVRALSSSGTRRERVFPCPPKCCCAPGREGKP